MLTAFETQKCSRCNGSGTFSYCTDYGNRCFKCGGSGKVLSKRGGVAKAYYIELCTVPVRSLKKGDKVYMTGVTLSGKMYGYIGTVENVRDDGNTVWSGTSENGQPVSREIPYLTIEVSSEKYGPTSLGVPFDSSMRTQPANNQELLIKAFEYQATLTKAGTVRK